MRVRTPAESVFEFLADPERYGYPAGTTITKDPPGTTDAGTRFDIRPRRFSATWEIKAYEPPTRLVIVSSDGRHELTSTYLLETAGDTTIIRFDVPRSGHSRFELLDAIDHLYQVPLLWLSIRRLERLLRRALERPA